MQNLELEMPFGKLDPFLAFVQSQENSGKKDRRASFEYFKEESKKLEARIGSLSGQTKKKKFTCFNK